MKRAFYKLFAVVTLFSFLLFGCGKANPSESTNSQEAKNGYIRISQSRAKEIIDSGEDIVILDARSEDEYNSGHIKGAVCIPHDEISKKAPELLKDKNQTILVYCRSGRRSKIAAQALADAGYTSVKEFGGINEWKYGTVVE